MIEKLLTIPQVAEALSIGVDTVRQMLKDNAIRASKVRGQWRITESAVNEYIEGSSNRRWYEQRRGKL